MGSNDGLSFSVTQPCSVDCTILSVGPEQIVEPVVVN